MTVCALTAKAGLAVGKDKARQMSCVVPSRRKTIVDGVQLKGGTAPLCSAVLNETGPNKLGSGLALYLHCFVQFNKDAVQYQLYDRREMMGLEVWKCFCCLCGVKPVCWCWQREKRLVRSGHHMKSTGLWMVLFFLYIYIFLLLFFFFPLLTFSFPILPFVQILKCETMLFLQNLIK